MASIWINADRYEVRPEIKLLYEERKKEVLKLQFELNKANDSDWKFREIAKLKAEIRQLKKRKCISPNCDTRISEHCDKCHRLWES